MVYICLTSFAQALHAYRPSGFARAHHCAKA
jgi:hypothetical protein